VHDFKSIFFAIPDNCIRLTASVAKDCSSPSLNTVIFETPFHTRPGCCAYSCTTCRPYPIKSIRRWHARHTLACRSCANHCSSYTSV
jgi:hypothetical protein